MAADHVLFLDFDGVLNSDLFLRRWHRTPEAQRSMSVPLDPRRIRMVSRICEATGATVVFSTRWCCFPDATTETLLGHLQEGGFTGEAIGCTPNLAEGWPRNPFDTGKDSRPATTRGDEIAAWLAEHPEVTSYAVLEDCEPMGPIPAERIVWTIEKYGMSEADARRVVEVLRG